MGTWDETWKNPDPGIEIGPGDMPSVRASRRRMMLRGATGWDPARGGPMPTQTSPNAPPPWMPAQTGDDDPAAMGLTSHKAQIEADYQEPEAPKRVPLLSPEGRERHPVLSRIAMGLGGAAALRQGNRLADVEQRNIEVDRRDAEVTGDPRLLNRRDPNRVSLVGAIRRQRQRREDALQPPEGMHVESISPRGPTFKRDVQEPDVPEGMQPKTVKKGGVTYGAPPAPKPPKYGDMPPEGQQAPAGMQWVPGKGWQSKPAPHRAVPGAEAPKGEQAPEGMQWVPHKGWQKKSTTSEIGRAALAGMIKSRRGEMGRLDTEIDKQKKYLAQIEADAKANGEEADQGLIGAYRHRLGQLQAARDAAQHEHDAFREEYESNLPEGGLSADEFDALAPEEQDAYTLQFKRPRREATGTE